MRFPKGSAPAEQFPDGFTYYGHNQNLINAVWTWADEVRPDLFPNDPNPGLTATKMAVEQTLGLKLDYYAQVNLKGFEDLVDAIGGVDFEVERRIPIGGGAAKIEGWIEPGWQHLDGYHALWYARSREGSSDFDRNCRQQRIVRAVTEEVDVPKVALSLPRLLSATQRNMVTDIPSSRLDAFADLAMRIQKGGFNSYPITPDVTNPGNPDWEYLHTWVQASIDDSMKGAAPKSVRGGDAKDGSAGTKDEAPASPTATPTATQEPSPSASESASPTESSSPSNTGTGGATKAPEIEKDPLWRCMPGNTDPND